MPKFEPILSKMAKAQPYRLRGQAHARPTRKPPFNSFFEITPAVFFFFN